MNLSVRDLKNKKRINKIAINSTVKNIFSHLLRGIIKKYFIKNLQVNQNKMNTALFILCKTLLLNNYNSTKTNNLFNIAGNFVNIIGKIKIM